jgi:hypothetical protein
MNERPNQTNTKRIRVNRKRHYSPSGGNASINISGAAGWIALALVLVQTMFILALWNRYDLLRVYYNDIRTELIARGMNPHPHLPSESP